MICPCSDNIKLLYSYIFSHLSASSKYSQIITLRDDLYQCNDTSFNQVISGLDNCEAYLDDIVVYSPDWSSHVAQLKALLDRLLAANLTVNLAKCEFAKVTITYLGKIVGQGQVRTVRAKVEAIDHFPVPQSRKDLRRFLGMTGYYRAFCPNFATVVSPLTDLLSPKIELVWTSSCQQAFDNAKALLVNAPILAAPNFEKVFKLAVDASETGAGAVLLQGDEQGIEHPVCFFSKKFNSHQRNYSVIEKEALAFILQFSILRFFE